MSSDRQIARRVEAAGASGTARAVRQLADTLGDPAYSALALEDGWLILTPPDVPLWGARGMGFEVTLSDSALARVEQAAFGHGVPAQIGVCPLADEHLGARLAARGYSAAPGCEVWVRDGTPAEAVPAPDGVVVTRVDSADEARITEFAELVARGYCEGEPGGDWNIAIGCNAARRPSRQAFVARVDGELAGGGLLGMTDGLASFTFMSTMPGHRRRGVQGALMRARLAAAIAAGADLVCVECEVGSPTARNAARLGFRHAYTRTTWTLPQPTRPTGP